MIEVGPEVCDACPFSDLESDLNYWINNVGQFCPWSGFLLKEVTDEITNVKNTISESTVKIFPNPTNGHINIHADLLTPKFSIEIFNAFGGLILKQEISPSQTQLSIREEKAGVYFVRIKNSDNFKIFKLLKI